MLTWMIYFIYIELKQLHGLYHHLGSLTEVFDAYDSFYNMLDIARIFTLGAYSFLEERAD
jgi:hypothetical protein